MGSKHAGKTCTGRELARLLSLPFFDLDRLVEERTGLSPRQLFETGPELFRRREAEALAALLKPAAGSSETPPPEGVLAAGGGIIDNRAAMALLDSPEHAAVYLQVSPETAWRRIAGSCEDRELPPFLRAENAGESREKHRILHERRSAAYDDFIRRGKGIRLKIQGENRGAGALAKEIRRRLGG
jgi:shikimate kinase